MATLLPGPFTVEMYHKLGVMGVFHEDDRVELLNGQIVDMTPIGNAHARCVFRLTNLFARYSTSEMGKHSESPRPRSTLGAATGHCFAAATGRIPR